MSARKPDVGERAPTLEPAPAPLPSVTSSAAGARPAPLGAAPTQRQPGTSPGAAKSSDAAHRGGERAAKGSRTGMLAALREPAFAWYWAGQLVSNTGTWSQTVAQAWLVLDLTHSAVALGTVTTVQFVPVLVFALAGGVVADRLPRRQLLVATQIALALQALTLGALVAAHIVTVLEVGLLAFALGATNALNNPAQQALIPDLVGDDLVGNAIALNSAQFNTARMIGGAVGGLAITAWGVSGAVFLNAASFLPIIGVLAVLRPAHAAAREHLARASAPAELRQGLAFAWSNRQVRRVVAIFGVVGLLGFNWQVAVPLVARFVLHRSAADFGDLMSGLGAGSLVAAVALTRYRRASERRLVVGGLALGAVLVVLGLSRWYWATLALMVVGGMVGIVASITANTRLQLLTPEHLRGRVMAIYVLLMGGTTPIGSFVLGEMAGHFGTGTALVCFGAATVAGVAAFGARRSGTATGSVVGPSTAGPSSPV
ncbi:MAG: MFS transporter [Acidimicrobiales bacterium]